MRDDNDMIVAQEIVHIMSLLRRKKGFTALKKNSAKVYDSIEWDFLHYTLCTMGMPNKLREAIMNYVTTPANYMGSMKSGGHKIVLYGEGSLSMLPTLPLTFFCFA